MTRLTFVAVGVALIASPCGAFTSMPAPVTNSGRSTLAPSNTTLAAAVGASSSMREAYIRNNQGWAGSTQVMTAPISLGGPAAIQATSQVTLYNGGAYVPSAFLPAPPLQLRFRHR